MKRLTPLLLHCMLSPNTEYGLLHDELIGDRIVVGPRDRRLSERMQLDQDLTLETAIMRVRQSKEVKRQQVTLRGTGSDAGNSKAINRVFKGGDKTKMRGKPQHSSTQFKPKTSGQCYRCGASPSHPKRDCPAKDEKCHACGRKGHYKRACTATKKVHEVEETGDEAGPFLGSITAKGMDRH